ncbi:MAG: hypothetical protein HRT72_06890 [Flavobacteriales bacterium]|nr:hypothetical protein [Flavobacteriales bacterium]
MDTTCHCEILILKRGDKIDSPKNGLLELKSSFPLLQGSLLKSAMASVTALPTSRYKASSWIGTIKQFVVDDAIDILGATIYKIKV